MMNDIDEHQNFHLLTYRFVRFSYTEVKSALIELDDGVFFVREMKESDEKKYEICIRYCICIIHMMLW